MNTKVFAIFTILLLVSCASIGKADLLDDLTSGTDRFVQSINENAEKVNHLADNLGVIAQILQKADLSQDKGDEEN